MTFTPIILIHLFAALGAVVVGGVTFALKKGTPVHRLFGRVWVALLLTTALVSFGIRTTGHFSWIHLLSVVSLAAVGSAIYAVVHGRINAHRRAMISVYIGLVSAGAFALLPDRRFGHLVWHAAGLV